MSAGMREKKLITCKVTTHKNTKEYKQQGFKKYYKIIIQNEEYSQAACR